MTLQMLIVILRKYLITYNSQPKLRLFCRLGNAYIFVSVSMMNQPTVKGAL